MIAELGHFALILAFALTLLATGTPALARMHPPLTRIMPVFAFLQLMLLTLSFSALIHCYAVSDFSVVNVALNSHSDKPLLYKITGAWGNHEGSMLLWVWVLAFYGVAIALKRTADRDLQERTLCIHALIMSGFLAFILATSNPFIRQFPPAMQGNDLNPLLQDIGLALHPPMLYLGYVGFGIVFSYAIAALWRGRIDSAWARETQPWILLAWSSLTLGIALGSWWAYRELGWGGWWFWDPVENVSLLPWFAGTALLHSNLVLERRNILGGWVLLLAIACFAMSLIGTFIVRSGLIMSVHAFASDPLRGNFILLYIMCVVGGALLLYACKRVGSPRTDIPLFSRVGGILVNNIFLLTLTATILLAILTPLILTLMKLPSITVGAPYFNTVFFPLAAPLVLLAGLGPLMPWQRITRQQWWDRISPLLMFAAAGAIAAFMIADRHLLLAMTGAAFSSWLVSATVWHGIRRFHAIPAIEDEPLRRRLRRFPLHPLGTIVAHLGLGILCAAITLSALGKERYEATLPPSGELVFGEYRLRVAEARRDHVDNYLTSRARFIVSHHGRDVSELTPEIRFYPARGMETSEAAIDSNLWRDVYLVMGHSDTGSGGTRTIGVRLYVTPGMTFLWIGFTLIAAGGGLSLLARLFSGARERTA